MRKIIFPIIYVCEWVLYLFALLFVFIYNIISLFNLIYIDMPWEEPFSLTSSFEKSLLIVLGMALIIFLYIRYLTGNRLYKIVKEVVWGVLLGLNTFSCLLWLIVSDIPNLTKGDQVLFMLVPLFSLILTIQIIVKLRKELK
ncbi:hypothetical protein [Psychrobacillus sp. NPDC093180]|uniref:hypothetical protein n=1 Tax=Psychrobacillus sp. NPDC093180 TaxID=3364489 RepID=UPI00380B58BC